MLSALVLTSSIGSSHGHASSQVLELVDSLLDLVGGSDDVDGLAVVGAGRKDDTAASLFQEVVQRATTVTNNELVSATLDRALFERKLLAELLSTALELSLNLLGQCAVTRNLDGEIGLRSEWHWLTTGCLRWRLGAPGVVLRNLNVDIAALRELVDVDIMGTGQEGVELGGDLLEAQVDSRGTLVDNGIDLATSHLSGERIALNVYVDNGIIILARLSLGHLNASTGALADLLNLGSLTTDDVRADGGRDGDIDRLLEIVS
jgi:hypothetical protein